VTSGYHGPALMQIVEHDAFKALNKVSRRYGHYVINADRRVFVKYSTSDKGPWQFTFGHKELPKLLKLLEGQRIAYFCLVCGPVTICCLTQAEWESVIDASSTETQWIKVQVPLGGQCHVTGTRAALGRAIPHKSFPQKVFL
jgi:hypothetical protein